MVEIASPSIPAQSKIVQAVAARARGRDAGVSGSAGMHALALSPLIIQDHLKSIFAKSGARSRNELVSQIFLEHYAPRWEDIPDVPVGWIAKASPIGNGGDPRPSPDAAILA